jgi:hypothetical protein
MKGVEVNFQARKLSSSLLDQGKFYSMKRE